MALLIAPALSRLYGAAPPETTMRIRSVQVKGLKAVPTKTILDNLRCRAGAAFSEKMVAEDARRILLLPQIADVKWQIDPIGDLVDLTFTVRESELIASVEFLGNKNLKTQKLSKKLGFASGDFLDRHLIRQGRENLTNLYYEQGYYFAEVSINEDLLQQQRRVVFVIVEGPKLRIKKVKFEGNHNLKTSKLKGKVKTKSYFPVFHKGALDDEKLNLDCLALQGYYRDEGFLDARVIKEVKFNENKNRALVTFIIEEGPRYRVAGIRFEGNQQLSEQKLTDALQLKSGQILTRKRRYFAELALTRAYGREGYIYAQVLGEPQYTERPGQVIVLFKITENNQFYLGQLLVQGNYKTQDKVVRREFDHFDFLPGSIYNTEAMEKARKRLLGMGLFENITVTPTGSAPDQRDALVETVEARTGLILFGVGVDTNSGILGQFSIEQRNFDIAKYPHGFGELFTGDAFTGAGQQLKFEFAPGTRVTTGYIRFHEPYLFDQPYYLDITASLFRRWRESYLERRYGTRTTLGHRFKNDWSAEFTFRAEQIKISQVEHNAPQDVQDVEGGNFLTSIKFGLGQNRTDNIFRPTEGYRLNAGWEQVGAMGGDFSFASLSAGASLYHTVYMDITERKTVLAANLRGNQIVGSAPVFERFYAGGIGSLRGFDYRGVSPRAGADLDPIGSNFLVLAGTELTHPLYEETFYGKLFCDTALLEEGPYRVTVGFGLELVVPQLFQMIPMHFDFGFPLVWDDQDDKEVFSFSFGLNF